MTRPSLTQRTSVKPNKLLSAGAAKWSTLTATARSRDRGTRRRNRSAATNSSTKVIREAEVLLLLLLVVNELAGPLGVVDAVLQLLHTIPSSIRWFVSA